MYNTSGKDCDVYVRLPMVEKGTIAHDWSPAPEDTDAKITANSTAIDQTNKEISLKADQTTVDKIKNTASQNSSRIDVMANEISSKVTSTDVNNIVNGKGYATTSTVQSLITQKAGTLSESITNLDAKYSAKDGVNIQRGTGDCSFPVATYNATVTIENYDDHTKMFHVKGAGGFYTSYNADTSFVPTVGETYTVSADVKGSGTTSGGFFRYKGADSCSLGTVTLTDTWQRISNTVHIGSVVGQWIFYLNNHAGDFYVKHIKIERGSVATPWTPAPSDNATVTQVQSLTASIDGLQSTVANKADKSQITQLSNVIQSKVSASDFNDLKDKTLWKSTDNIDLNNAVSQQKIFVKGGSNLPPGDYWWYVQVESGYDSRIVQYAVSDRDNIHYSRQYDGSKWSAWSQGATESEITQLRDDINLRVKSGDLLSQINLTAHNTLIQSNKIYLDSSSTVFSGKAFIPSAAIVSLDADKITTGVLNGIDIHQIATKEGRSIDISGGNITLDSWDPYAPRLSFKYQGQMVKMFNASGDLEADTWGIFNFSPSDTQSLHPIQFFRVNNVGGKGSGSARMQLDHAIFDGHEWWANFDGITFGRSYDGINGSNDYVELYAKSFLPHSQLSSKTRIEKLDGEDAMSTIKQVQMYTYQFKDDVRDGKTKRYASLIIDDVHDVAQYTEPDIFVADNKKCRDDGTQLAYAIAAIQYQQHEIEELKVQLKEKKTNE